MAANEQARMDATSDNLPEMLHKRGVRHWNEWRDKNPGLRPSLQQSILSGQVMIGVNLSDADLSGADLTVCEMTNANLAGANLHAANLSFCGLNGALITNADFSDANLRGIQLKESRFSKGTIWPTGFDPQAAGAILVE